jgi:hypothetical protein
MTNVKLNKLKARALRVAPYLDRLPEEQVEAIFASAIKYHPKSLMDRIRILEASVSKEEFKLILGGACFLPFLELWDEDQRQVNTLAFVDELYQTIPEDANASKDDVAAWVQLQKMMEEEED